MRSLRAVRRGRRTTGGRSTGSSRHSNGGALFHLEGKALPWKLKGNGHNRTGEFGGPILSHNMSQRTVVLRLMLVKARWGVRESAPGAGPRGCTRIGSRNER